MSVVLAALAACLLVAACAELWAERGEHAVLSLSRRLRRGHLPGVLGRLAGAGGERAMQLRLRRAGLEGRLGVRALVGFRLLSALAALPAATLAAPLAPGRAGVLVLAGVPAGASFLPDLVVERVASLRRARIAAALPDALELMAVGAATGRSQTGLIADAARISSGPLREELAGLLARLEAGGSQARVLSDPELAADSEVGALVRRLDRSRRLGAPLGRGLHEQALGLREEQARRVAEQAARAAPKIQLVVALLLVPSVLLIVGAAILANADALLVGL